MRATTGPLAYDRRLDQTGRSKAMTAQRERTFPNTVYAAIELSKKNWVLGIARLIAIGRASIGSRAGICSRPVTRLRTAARSSLRILVCYEAGYDGFWLARSLAKNRIDCRVLDPASIQVNRRARRVKTDRIDVLALLAGSHRDRPWRAPCVRRCSGAHGRRGRRSPVSSRAPTPGPRAYRPYQPHQGPALRPGHSGDRAEAAAHSN